MSGTLGRASIYIYRSVERLGTAAATIPVLRAATGITRGVAETLGIAGARELTTVSVEHGYMKVMVSQGLDVLDYRVVTVAPQLFREGLASDAMRLATLLQRVLNDMVGSHRHVIGAVPGYQTTLQLMELPNARSLDPGVVIPREAQRTMGISPETSTLTWRRLPGALDVNQWLVLSATTRSMSTMSAIAQAAGLRLEAMELRPFSLARAINQPDAICAWTAYDGCDALVIRDWIPVAHQAAYWGPGSELEATDLINRITEVVESTVTSYNTQNTDALVTDDVPVYVSGSPAAREQGIARRVAANMRRTAGELESPLALPPDFPIHDMVVNTGLALWQA